MAKKPNVPQETGDEGVLVSAAKAIGSTAAKIALRVGAESRAGPPALSPTGAKSKSKGKLPKKNKQKLPRREKKSRQRAAALEPT